MFLSFPPPTKMFQFRGLAHLTVWYDSIIPGCPIRISADQLVFANPRSFSQLTTSFVAFESLGIPHLLFLTFLTATAPFAKLLQTLSHSLIMSMNSLSLLGRVTVAAFTQTTAYITDYPLGTLVENKGVEPLTSCVQSRRSSQLS